MGRTGGRLDTKVEIASSQEDRCDSYAGLGHPFVTITDQKDRGRHSSQERKRTGSLGDGVVIRGDSKTVVDWINGKAKQKVSYRAIATIQIQLMDRWKKGVDLCHRIGDWAVPIFREHNKEPDLWASFGAKGISMEWKDESAIDWTKVTGICGFWDGSCNDKVCGAGITISFFI